MLSDKNTSDLVQHAKGYDTQKKMMSTKFIGMYGQFVSCRVRALELSL